jgi:NADH-quinone oxidoreductase subunit H
MDPQFVASMITILVAIHVILLGVAYLIMLERKISAWIQDRVGPNRVGPGGMFQPIADGLKFILKEDFTPLAVDKVLFSLAPVLAVVPALIGWAVIPWGGYMQWGEHTIQIVGAPLGIGVIYILAVGSLAVYGIVLGGYASNNKYSFLGGLRATAQMLSYEIPLALCVLIVILMWGTLQIDLLIHAQANSVWNIFYHPFLAVIMFTALLAESNRAPFDLAEAESELVGGYHTEYSAMRFALFFLGEYMHMITGCAFFALLFLGGWDLPLIQEPLVAGGFGWVALKFAAFIFKIFLLLSLMMIIRWTLPRFRFDQLMRLAWRSLIPVCLVLLLVTGLVVFLRPANWSPTAWYFLLLPANILAFVALIVIGPAVPEGPPVNRRVPLAGSRFSPLVENG